MGETKVVNEETRVLSKQELMELIEKILCQQLGVCSTKAEVDKMPIECIPVLKVGENYIQYVKEMNAYRVWAKDGTYIGIKNNKNALCKNLSEWSDGKHYGVK